MKQSSSAATFAASARSRNSTGAPILDPVSLTLEQAADLAAMVLSQRLPTPASTAPPESRLVPRFDIVPLDTLTLRQAKRPNRSATRPNPERRAQRVLPAAPLLRQLELRGGVAACGISPRSAKAKAVTRARTSGVVSRVEADRLACELLGMHPLELWGDDFLSPEAKGA